MTPSLVLASLLFAPPHASLVLPGVVLDEVGPGFAAMDAGLRAGDILTAWRQELDGQTLTGAITSPFDMAALEDERHPLGPLVLVGVREGAPFEATVEPEAWGFQMEEQPLLAPDLREQLVRGAAEIEAGRVAEGVAVWGALADRLAPEAGARAGRCWLLGKIAVARAEAKAWDEGRAALRDAVACAEPLAPAIGGYLLAEYALVEIALGAHASALENLAAARARFRDRPLIEAQIAFCMERPLLMTRRHEEAVEHLLQAYDLQDAILPDGLLSAWTLAVLARTLTVIGDFAAADEAALRSFALAEAAAPPDNPTWAGVLAPVLLRRGDLVGAERVMRRTVAWQAAHLPESEGFVVAQNNLANLLAERGDLVASEQWLRSAQSIAARLPRAARAYAVVTYNLGLGARDGGDLDQAVELLKAAELRMGEAGHLTPNHIEMIGTLGDALRRRGDRTEAREYLERAADLVEQLLPGSALAGGTYFALGELARDEGDAEQAEELFRIAVEIQERVAPGSLELAQSWNELARMLHGRGENQPAFALSARALDVVDGKRDRFKGSDEARSLYASRFFGIYQDRIQWLVEAGRVQEAFDLLEHSRARSLLALVAERDLLLEDDLPPELERERRAVDAEYERTRDRLKGADGPETERLRLALDVLRQKQEEVAAAIRQASPRLADLRSPESLRAVEVAAQLEEGSLLLSYSVGRARTVVFALAGGARAAPRLRAVLLDVGAEALGKRVAAWRQEAERTVPSASFRREALSLHALLVGPFEAELRDARRLVISADGPLHALPFAALRDGERYLVERLPVQTIISGTLHAQLVRTRPTVSRPRRVVAYGDPFYGAEGPPPLGGSRREVQALARLFPGAATYLGTDASEEHAKGAAQAGDYVHFAVHGLVDEHSPLDSALLMATPPGGAADADNGRLHAWEIFEGVRLTADLVTLSACRSALGGQRAGEGMLGLARAFQFAGARTVVASLWDVGDRSSAVFMRRFYGALKRGAAKDEALRTAQVAAIRSGDHPVRWAAFKAFGDWR